MPWIRDAKGLFINVPNDEPPKWRCTVPVKHDDGENTICGTPFFDGQYGQFVRHVTACARKHQDVIQQAAPSSRLPDWLTQQNATDWEDWLDRQDAAGESNRRKVIEGRKKF